MKQRSLTLQQRTAPRNAEEPDGFIDLDRLFSVVVASRQEQSGCSWPCFVVLGGRLPAFRHAELYLDDADPARREPLEIRGRRGFATKQRSCSTPRLASAVEILKSGELALRVVDKINLADNDTDRQSATLGRSTVVKDWMKSDHRCVLRAVLRFPRRWPHAAAGDRRQPRLSSRASPSNACREARSLPLPTVRAIRSWQRRWYAPMPTPT